MIEYLNRHTSGGYEIESAYGKHRIIKKDSHGGFITISDWMTRSQATTTITAINNILKEERT